MAVYLIVDQNHPSWNHGFTEREADVAILLQKAKDDASQRAREWQRIIREKDASGVEYDREFFQKTMEEYRDADFAVMKQEDWINLNMTRFLSETIEEITEEKYYEMMDILPPLHMVSRNGVTEFCMCEMYWGSITTQCAHDKETCKYWWKKVDSRDPSTWIDQILRMEA